MLSALEVQNQWHPALRVALAQIPVADGDFEQNLRLAEAAATEAARLKVQLLNLPEAADWGWLYQQARRDALPIPGKYTQFLCDLARRHKLWISAGCLEQDADKTYNILKVASATGLWVIGTNAVLGTVQGGEWKGWLHCGCSLVARPDGSPAVVARFKQPDFVVFDLPATRNRGPSAGKT